MTAVGVTEIANGLTAWWQDEPTSCCRSKKFSALVTLERDCVPTFASVLNLHFA